MKIFLASAFLLAFAASQVYSQACHMREVDLCTAIGMFHYQSNGVPSDDEKVTEWCETIKEVQDCMGNFTSKCMSPLQREVIGLLSGADENAGQLCIEGSEMRARYLTHGECLAEAAESDEFKGHLRDIQAMVEKLFDVPFKHRFTLLCCGFDRFHKGTESYVEGKCGEPAVAMVRHIMDMITTDLPKTICQRFDSSTDECQDILPPPGTPSKGGENRSQIAKLLDTVFGN